MIKGQCWVRMVVVALVVAGAVALVVAGAVAGFGRGVVTVVVAVFGVSNGDCCGVYAGAVSGNCGVGCCCGG